MAANVQSPVEDRFGMRIHWGVYALCGPYATWPTDIARFVTLAPGLTVRCAETPPRLGLANG